MARLVVTRPVGQEHELASRLRSLGHEVRHCPLIAIEPLGDEPIDVARLRLGGRHEPQRRPRAVAACERAAAPYVPRSGRPRRRRSAAPISFPRVSTQEGLLDELPRPAGRVLFAAAEGARRLLADDLGATFLALYRTVELEPDACPGCRPRRPLFRVAGQGAGPHRIFAACRVDRARDDPRRPHRRRRGGRGSRDARPAWPRRGRGGGNTRALDLVGVFVCFLTDFGLQDDFVGTCHGVIERIAPEAR